MQTFEKGGLRAQADGAALGPAIMRPGPLDPKTRPADLAMVVAAIDHLTHTVDTLRKELASRSLGGRWQRVKVWCHQAWQSLRRSARHGW